ncbi:MAG: D-alanyl-D-alanine carboxypeptidase family protein [Pseudomonadota bacterium]
MTLMKQLLAFATLLVWLLASLQAQAAVPIPSPPQLSASSWILMDHATGRVLAEHDADERIEPASITKVMTSYVVYQALEQGLVTMDDAVPVSEKAWRMGGSRMFIEAGKQVPLSELIKGLVIQSGNDAAVALAEHIGGSEAAFAGQMNATARALGMENTHFVNATGWPHEEHYSTARDIAIMSRALIRDFPEHYGNNSVKSFTFNNISQRNRNDLLWRDPAVDGIKTGHTEAAGYCLAASARRDDMRLISVVMGTNSKGARAQASQTLLNYGFRYYDTRKLYGAGETVRTTRVWKGDAEGVDIGPSKDLFVTVPRGQYKNLKPTLEGVASPLEAPVAKGQRLGEIRVSLEGEVVARAPAVALQQVDEGGLIDRAWDSILLMFE